MKLDSKPVSLSGLSLREGQSELKEDTSFSTPATTIVATQPIKADESIPQQSTQAQGQSTLGIFGSTFITIFLAELGDKTQLSTLLMSAESESPWIVFIGAAMALITTSFLGVVLGGFIANKLSPKTVDRAAAASLLLIAVTLLWDVVHS